MHANISGFGDNLSPKCVEEWRAHLTLVSGGPWSLMCNLGVLLVLCGTPCALRAAVDHWLDHADAVAMGAARAFHWERSVLPLVLHWPSTGAARALHWSCTGPAVVLQWSCSGGSVDGVG